MNKKLLIGIIAAVVIVGGIGVYLVVQKQAADSVNSAMSNMPGMSTNTNPDALVQKDSDTYKTYAAMTGETFDRTFIANMIAHHEGAVAMAKLALANAKYQEIKTMANDIIAAQSSEITKMQQWQSDWGYPSSSSNNMQDHSAMVMMGEMMDMEDMLKGKTGDDFDKAFLSGMIMHHQSAINMAAPGEANAQHQEVKDLTRAIVAAQSKEISQMQAWQKDWGYTTSADHGSSSMSGMQH